MIGGIYKLYLLTDTFSRSLVTFSNQEAA